MNETDLWGMSLIMIFLRNSSTGKLFAKKLLHCCEELMYYVGISLGGFRALAPAGKFVLGLSLPWKKEQTVKIH